MLAALVLSLVPASTVSVQPAAAASICNWAQFITDVNVPDGTNVLAGLTFTKTWRLKNIGTCTWTTSYALVYSSGDKLGGSSSTNLKNSVAPGQTVELSVNLTAPSAAGHYIGFWQLKNSSGTLFGIGSSANKAWWVDFNVLGTSTSSAAYDFAANYCSAAWISLQGNLPCPGSDGDPGGFVLKVDNPQLEDGSFATGSGLIMMPQSAYNGDIHAAFPAFRVQSGDRFRSVVNCAFGATSCFVTFRLDYQIGNGPINTFWSLREKYEGLFFRTDLDLSPLAGQDVKFILTVLATGPATGDRALWSNPIIARAGPIPPAPYARNFDFGTSTSPLATGYTRVTQATVYTTGAFGWANTSGLKSVDRSSLSDALKRDFVMNSSAARTFKVDLPNGNYAVTVTMGDYNTAHDNMVVKAQGTTVLGDVDTAARAFAVNTFNVTVSSDTLSLEFSDAGGKDPAWVINGIAISTGTGTTPPANCDRAQFVTDVSVPDGTTFAPGAAFTKTWRLKNIGTCTWTTSYAMVFDTGDKMSGPDSVAMPKSVAPGQTVDVSVNLTAPATAGSYRAYWLFQNANGTRFGLGNDGTKSWWVDIKVSGTAITGTPTASPPATWTPSTTSTSTATPTQTQTSTSTPTPTASGPDTIGWNTYMDGKYLFSFKFPPGSTIASQSDNLGRVYLPITPGTNLSEKWVSISVVEGANPCKSPTVGLLISSENVTINGIQFLKETGMDGAAGSRFDATAYSTLKGNACISLSFVLRSANLGNFPTPPPAFDKDAESAVFPVIMSTYANQ
jgi:hypothetical protein